MKVAKIGDEIRIENRKNPFIIRVKEGELWIDTLLTGDSPKVKCKKLGTLIIYAK